MKRNHFWPAVKSRAALQEKKEKGQRASTPWQRLWSEQDGQTLVEYGLLIGLLALVVIAAVTFFGRRMSNNLYGTSNNVLPFNN